MSKWIAEFELEDGDTMPEHMDLNYMGAKIDFHCKPLEQKPTTPTTIHAAWKDGSFLHTKLVDKTGYTKIGECYCSNCRSYLDFSDNYRVPGRYCPWCGAKMEEIE